MKYRRTKIGKLRGEDSAYGNPTLQFYADVLHAIGTEGLPAHKAARKLGCCRKTINRTVSCLRDLGVNIVFVSPRKGYRILPPVRVPEWFVMFGKVFEVQLVTEVTKEDSRS